jgi:hypothetical protein
MTNRDVIEKLRDKAASDAEALAQMFESASVADDSTVAGRLRAILEATESRVVPGLQTGITFHDIGFRREFKDRWPSSDNQVGHFLTAVGLSFNPAKVAESFAGRPLRNWLGADSSMSDEEVAIRLCIGHEKAADPGPGTAAVGGFLGFGVGGGAAGAAVGAGVAVLMAFRDQFAAATDADVQTFRSAEANLGTAQPLNLAAAMATLRGIAVNPSLRGNSYEDLVLTCFGWRLGQSIKRGEFAARADVGRWIRTNIFAP